MAEQQLSGRVALVTGGGRGIGRAIALALADAGASVVITARSRDELDETVRLVGERRGPAVAEAGDVTKQDDVERVVQAAQQAFGPVDLLVNNAGTSVDAFEALWHTDPEQWWRVVEVNLRGPFLFSHAVLPGMVERGRGAIVNINSLVGTDARAPGASAYAVSKAGLFRLTDSLAAQLAGTEVCVFDLSPGLVRTQMTDGREIFRNVPEDQWTPAERSAEVVVALASGKYDALSGRFVHATEDLDALLAHADQIVATNARVLGLRLWGEGDPLGE